MGDLVDLETELCWPGLETVSGEAGVSASACRGTGETEPGPSIRRNTEEKMEELVGEALCVSGEHACKKQGNTIQLLKDTVREVRDFGYFYHGRM